MFLKGQQISIICFYKLGSKYIITYADEEMPLNKQRPIQNAKCFLINGNYECSYMIVTVQQYLAVHNVKCVDQWWQPFFGMRAKSRENIYVIHVINNTHIFYSRILMITPLSPMPILGQ